MILRLIDRRAIIPTGEGGLFPLESRKELLSAMVSGVGRQDWTVDLVLVDDEAMTDLNRGYRHAEGVTDVLSFSYLEGVGTGVCDLAAGDGCAQGDLWLESTVADAETEVGPVAGEVILAPGFITRRCLENGWSLEHEVPMLVVHGLLHILGWDHADDTETMAMQAVEQEILSGAGLPHPMLERG